jgi:uncharacterized protein YjiS (DUF1127 family)
MSLINLFVATRSAVARWRQRERAYGELMALDDRSLADIGIHRSQIPAIVEESYRAGRGAAARDTSFDAEPARAWLAVGHR